MAFATHRCARAAYEHTSEYLKKFIYQWGWWCANLWFFTYSLPLSTNIVHIFNVFSSFCSKCSIEDSSSSRYFLQIHSHKERNRIRQWSMPKLTENKIIRNVIGLWRTEIVENHVNTHWTRSAAALCLRLLSNWCLCSFLQQTQLAPPNYHGTQHHIRIFPCFEQKKKKHIHIHVHTLTV